MKIRMLTGACGLALAGSAMAAPNITYLKDMTAKAMTEAELQEARAARSEGVSRFAPRRSLISGAARGGFAYQDTLDGLDTDQMRPANEPGMYIRQLDLTEPSGYEGDLTIDGQLNPDNSAWAAGDTWPGIVDNAVAQSDNDMDPANGEYNGPVGGPDPMGVRGGMASMQSSSIQRDPVPLGSAFPAYDTNHSIYVGTVSDPLFAQIDVYRPTFKDFMWFRPNATAQGLNVNQMFSGGFSGTGFFQPWGAVFDDPTCLEGMMMVANVPNDPTQGEFVVGAYPIAEGGWFTIGLLIEPANFEVCFIKDDVTTADSNMDGTPDYVMPMNMVSGMRMFEEYGLGVEEGWVSVFPGTLDDPMTPDEIEGAGYTVNEENRVMDRFFFQGNDVSSIFSGISIDRLRMYVGSDPTSGQDPTYFQKDWWWDDYRITGIEFPIPDPIPTYRIPYVDDMERWSVGPLGLQGGRYNETPDTRSQIVASRNNTAPPGTGAGGMPTQSLQMDNRVQSDFFDEMITANIPSGAGVDVISEIGDPAVFQAAMRTQSDFISYGLEVNHLGLGVNVGSGQDAFGNDAGESMRIFTAGIDTNLLGDGNFYVRQRKPRGTNVAMGEYDENLPEAPTAGPHLTPDQEETINTEYINVAAAPAGMANYQMPIDTWVTISLECEPNPMGAGANGEDQILRVFVDDGTRGLVELFPGGDSMSNFSTTVFSPNQFQIASSNSFNAGFVELNVDDIFFDGPLATDTLVPLSLEFADDPDWSLPFFDSLDTYEKGRPAVPQGAADHRLGFMPIGDPDVSPVPNDWDEIEFIDGAAALTNGDSVRVYEVVSVDMGAPGFMVGDFVAVSDDIDLEYDPGDEIYGVFDPMLDPTEWYILDTLGGSEIARGTWRLATATGEDTYDDMTMVDMGARYSYRKNFRYTGTERESEFVSAAAEGIDFARGASRGDIVKMTNLGNVRDFEDNGGLRTNIVTPFLAFLPLATPGLGMAAELSFDIYVGQSTLSTGFVADIDGGTHLGGNITAISFGGDGLQVGNESMNVIPFGNPNNIHFEIANPLPTASDPEEIFFDTGVPVPTETWATVTVILNPDKSYEIFLDGASIGTGTASDAADAALNTQSLDNLQFYRNQFGEADGQPTEGVIQWSARAADANAPVSGGTDEYHFYQITSNDVRVEMGETAPDIWAVADTTAGTMTLDMMGMPVFRALQPQDRVAIINNDPVSMMPFDLQLLNERFQIVRDDMMGGNILVASGEWSPLGLPGVDGAATQAAPAGGIAAGAPPYGAMSPFQTYLLGDYVDVEGVTVIPSDVWYVDNIGLRIIQTCIGDLDGNGSVGAGDLAIMIAAWGISDAGDLNGDTMTGAADLAILIAAWGPCP